MDSFSVAGSEDGTKLLSLSSGMKAVAIPSKNGKLTFCLSTQLGCSMGCIFCRAGKFKRNLAKDEIIEQFSALCEVSGRKPTAVVFMGMGEPMLNFGNVEAAIHKLNKDFGISYRSITLSTCGINLDKLLEVRYHVAVSLHAVRREARKKIIGGGADLQDIVEFTKNYKAKRNHGVMLELVLVDSINDSEADLKALLDIDWPKNVSFNLLNLNEFAGLKQSRSIEHWRKAIIDAGFKCLIRESKGTDIEAACGMLD
jgi:23S rRNA (adenine2503-C2)-methyltransferase